MELGEFHALCDYLDKRQAKLEEAANPQS